MWWTAYSSRSTSVPVDVQHSGGTTRVTINQKLNGGKWNGLGIYSLIAGTSYTVTVTSQPGPSSTSADAVRIAYLQDAVGYVAVGGITLLNLPTQSQYSAAPASPAISMASGRRA
jgi:hypothetical protein